MGRCGLENGWMWFGEWIDVVFGDMMGDVVFGEGMDR